MELTKGVKRRNFSPFPENFFLKKKRKQMSNIVLTV